MLFKEKNMSEYKKDNHDYEFIKEQVIVRKHNKFKKWLYPFLMTVFMAILFGIIAAITFCITEPRFYKLLHKEDSNKTPIAFPTNDPQEGTEETETDKEDEQTEIPNQSGNGQAEEVKQEPEPVILEKSIDADAEDFLKMYDDIKTIAYNSGKSIVKISSIINEDDWFGNPVDKEVITTGLIIANHEGKLLVLVSLDRVKDASSIDIVFSDNVKTNAVLHGYEQELNLAIIAAEEKEIPDVYRNNIKVATLGESYSVNNGSPVIALGSPNGHPGSMEVGMITSRGSVISITDNRFDLFNTDIIDNKNSDGVIVNLKGEVIGIITRTLKKDLNKDLNTVIGISKLKSIIQTLANQDPMIYFGIIAEDMTDFAKQEHSVENGIYVETVQANSPAFEAGIKNGDIILEVDGQTVVSTNRFYNIISEYKPEQKVSVKIKRTTSTTADKEMIIDVTLGEKNDK